LVFPTLSDPARSTRLSLESEYLESVRDRVSTYMVKMQCDRDECKLRECPLMTRWLSP